MTTTGGSLQIVPQSPPSALALRAADQGVASALESVLSDNTQRVYGAQWRLFTRWCDEIGLRSLPADPLTVARYLAPRAGDGAGMRLATSAIAKAHEWAGHEIALPGPGRARGVEGLGKTPFKEARQAGALTADVLAVIRLTAIQPRKRGRGFETPEQAAERGRFDLALVAVLSDGGLRRSEAASLTWGDVQRWDDGSGRITVIRSKTDVEAQGAVVAITPAAMNALDTIRPVGVGGEMKVFGLSESQIARRVKVIARAAGLADWEFFSGRVGMARRMAQNGAPTHEIKREGRWKQGASWSITTPPASPQGRHCATFSSVKLGPSAGLLTMVAGVVVNGQSVKVRITRRNCKRNFTLVANYWQSLGYMSWSNRRNSGKLIVFEGPYGVGKSTFLFEATT